MVPNMKRYPEPQEIELKLIASLRDKRYKLTPQRLEIIKRLSYDRSHPGAMDIFRKLKKTSPTISMSTVYYTLDILKKEGLIQELEFYDRDNRYDINVSNHINLICRKCGKIEDFVEPLPFSSAMIEGKTGFRPIGMRFEYYGYCKGCMRKKQR
jgi:Fur family transcriptional regulator, peroxide stress response regulator